jgi:hypothetical protein
MSTDNACAEVVFCATVFVKSLRGVVGTQNRSLTLIIWMLT